ncbi:MAG: phosphatidate cytidylyltransferase [Mariprofundaceae bacterium]
MRETMTRLATAAVLLALAWWWYAMAAESVYRAGVAVIGMVAGLEMLRMSRAPFRLIHAAALFGVLLGLLTQPSPMWLVPLLLAWFALQALDCRHAGGDFQGFLARAWLGAWLLLALFVLLATHGTAEGRWLVIGTCVAVWISDTIAYFAGRAWGKHRLCPAISPGKSVEGAAAAVLVASPLAAWTWVGLAGWSATVALALALLAVVSGMLGDLSESAVKRMLGVKDSGRWLPGHGGVLDRVDAPLMALPVVWFAWKYSGIGGGA